MLLIKYTLSLPDHRGPLAKQISGIDNRWMDDLKGGMNIFRLYQVDR